MASWGGPQGALHSDPATPTIFVGSISLKGPPKKDIKALLPVFTEL